MHCTEWRYRCDACQHRFNLPGADLSFHHGVFLGVSATPEAAFLDAINDPAYAEIHALVTQDARTEGMSPADAGGLVRDVVGSVFDPDGMRSPYDFNGTPPCPRCLSSQIELLHETQAPWLGAVIQATHRQWDTLPPAAKAAAVKHVLDNLLH
jgi:hypothetical protein